ncbi:MAG: hypothetical protein GWO08_11500, partial [Gammaproteobacteria bacterium]|nr:hypothetical protein [Gammaproteobacteria bacterium]NIR94258.1 hypothetical protein [Gammaproteobacteria bacterium]NIW43632.1 hypothetical protein [Gammaproteobacteria bacterium]NIX54756.1 hypothetical protein [candidate division Zixibacteria bacterium]
MQNEGWYMGEYDWEDTTGTVWQVKLTGAAPVTANETQVTMPILQATGDEITRYFRNQPPSITVDGMPLQDPFPLPGDYVEPDSIPGTAEVMVKSVINTDLGVTIEEKALGWGQKHHDNYIIFDWTITNTGNVDTDSEIELPDQTLDSLYYLRASRLDIWHSEYWYSGRGEYEEDTLRVHYAYPGDPNGGGDDTGLFYLDDYPGYIHRPHTVGTAVLHVDASPTDPTDDWNQPAMTGTENSDLLWIRNDPSQTSPAEWKMVYDVMSQGWDWRGNVPELTDGNNPYPSRTIRPGNHSVRMEDLGVIRGVRHIHDFEWTTYGASYFFAIGPFTLGPGESVRVVHANGYGSL